MGTQTDSVLSLYSNEENWIIMMKMLLNKEELVCDIDNPPYCISKAPKAIRSIKEEAVVPQRIAIGPYHHFKSNLYKMEKCKLEHVKVAHQHLQLPSFELLVDHFQTNATRLRGYYQEVLDVSDDTLSWIMVIDGLFLLQLICNEDPLEFVDSSGRSVTMETILRDVIMLENQIPFFVLENLLAESNHATKIPSLFTLAMKFLPKISPMELQGIFMEERHGNALHLLDFVYNLVCVGGSPVPSTTLDFAVETISLTVWSTLWNTVKTLNFSFLALPVKIIDSTLNVLASMGISFSLQIVEEKALIPTASELSKVKVKLSNTAYGIRTIHFSHADTTLHLPKLTMNINSGTTIGNLLAYEAVAKPETPNFARYMQMMAAMVHTGEDLELLKSQNILKHEGESGNVVKLFNGLRHVLIPDGQSDLDFCIKNINDYYNSRGKIRVKNFIKQLAHSSWRALTVLAIILVLALMALQNFCSIYSCQGLFMASKNNLISSF